MMCRRTLFGGVAILALSNMPFAKARTADLDARSSVKKFHWTNAGGDKLQMSPAQALALPHVTAVVPEYVRAGLLAELGRVRQRGPNYIVQDGDMFQNMLSGKDGWVAINVVADVHQWRRGISRNAWVAYFRDRGGKQWRIVLFEACLNIGIDCIDAPVQCVCGPHAACQR